MALMMILPKAPIIRHCESQKWVPAHKVQYLYLVAGLFPFIYFLDYSSWILQNILPVKYIPRMPGK